MDHASMTLRLRRVASLQVLASQIASLAVGALILVWPALWNGYPLVFADTGTYLGQTLLGYLGWDRPIFYSVFLRLTHWRVSLWFPVIAKGLIVAHVLSIALRLAGLRGPMPLLITCAGLALFTGLPWFVGQLMPDLFTGVLVLALWLLGFADARLGPVEWVWLLLLAAGAITVHQAHLPLGMFLVLAGGGLAWMREGAAVARRVVVPMATPVLLAAIALVTMNFAGHDRVSLSPFGSVFLAARLIHDGPARETLNEFCPETGWRICAVRQSMPTEANNFLWLPDSPLHGVLDGPKAWAAEAAALVGATVLQHPGAVLSATIRNAVAQFGMVDTGDGLDPWPGVPGPEPLIASSFAREHVAFLASRQQTGLLWRDAATIAPLHRLATWLGLGMLVILVVRIKQDRLRQALCVLVLAAAIGNAGLTGALSGPHHRYQSRLAWLFVLAPAVVVMHRSASRRDSERSSDVPRIMVG